MIGYEILLDDIAHRCALVWLGKSTLAQVECQPCFLLVLVDLLRELQRRHRLAYVFISHDLRVVRALANHLLVMKGGRVVEAGPARRVFDRPQHPYTRALLAAALNLEAVDGGVVAT